MQRCQTFEGQDTQDFGAGTILLLPACRNVSSSAGKRYNRQDWKEPCRPENRRVDSLGRIRIAVRKGFPRAPA